MSDKVVSPNACDAFQRIDPSQQEPTCLLRKMSLMALTAIFTVVAISATLEIGARAIFTQRSNNRCSLPGGYYASNCISQPLKLWEGPWFTESYNDCGFRTAEPCSVRPRGLRRVAVIGTSQAHGMDVPYDQTFAARSTAKLRVACGGPVDFQNLSLPGAFVGTTPLWHEILSRMPQAMALHPVAVITILSSNDLATYETPPSPSTPAAEPRRPIEKLVPKFSFGWVKQTVATDSIAMLAIRSVFFRNTEMYLDRYLSTNRGDFLSPQINPKWLMRLRIAESVLGPMEEQAKVEGVPFIAFFYPTYPHAIAAKEAASRPDLAPYSIQTELRRIVEAHGGKFFDITPAVAGQPNPADVYYVSNDHPNGWGHKVMADEVVRDLIASVPAFATCRRTAS